MQIFRCNGIAQDLLRRGLRRGQLPHDVPQAHDEDAVRRAHELVCLRGEDDDADAIDELEVAAVVVVEVVFDKGLGNGSIVGNTISDISSDVFSVDLPLSGDSFGA